MNFGRFTVITTALLSFCAAASAGPVTHVLDTTNYNFALNGGGGGAQALLDKNQNIEIFCVDFANDISVPHQNYSADLSTITSGSDLSATRFGGQTMWSNVSSGGAFTNAEATSLNGLSSALGRYQMAAYLVSTYNLNANPVNNSANNGIQQAIWDILDPKTFQVVTSSSVDNALASAVTWYNSNPTSARDSFLTNYRIVSDASLLTSCKGQLVSCGFQEQITVVPEPRHLAVMLIGLLLVGSAAFRKLRAAHRFNA